MKLKSEIKNQILTDSPGRRGARGIALVITLLMLSVITFLAVALLILTRSHRTAVSASIDQTTSRTMSDAALARAESEILARMMAVNTNNGKFTGDALDYDYMVSTNFFSPGGFTNGLADITNVNYGFSSTGAAMSSTSDPVNWAQNIADLYFDPRPPVFIQIGSGSSTSTDFRFWVDINRNGRFEANGVLPVLDNNGNPIASLQPESFNGEPEWIGVLKYPEYFHSATNPFIGRYAFMVLPIGKTLDFNYIHNFSKYLASNPNDAAPVAMPAVPSKDEFSRDQGVGSWELNLAAMFADLNTNDYPPGTASYSYNSVGTPNSGTAFDDAYSFLRFRYGGSYGPYPGSFLNYFPFPNTPNYAADGIDEYGAGFKLPGLPFYTNVTAPWPGNYTTNMFYDIQDVFVTNKTSPEFVTGLSRWQENLDSYDRYTFQRLIAGIGTGSEPELQTYVYNDGFTALTVLPNGSEVLPPPTRLREKVNINYDNSFEIANGPVSAVTNYNGIIDLISTGMNTSPTLLTNWTNALAFFTNAAESLVRSQNYPVTNYSFFGIPTNIVYNHFGLTNIPVYSSTNPSIRYTENLHRMLQLAANIYEATQTNNFTTSTTYPLPVVFRPIFSATNYDPVTKTNFALFIVGYTNVNPAFAANQITNTRYWFPSDTNITTMNSNDNVWGIPWVIAAVKGLPEFDRYSSAASWEIVRKLEFTRYQIDPGIALSSTNNATNGDSTRPPQYTNVFYIMSITNGCGIDALNDYATNFHYPYHVYVRNIVSVVLKNNSTNTPNTRFSTNFVFSLTNTVFSAAGGWPDWGTANSNRSMPVGMMAFLQANVDTMNPEYYSQSDNQIYLASSNLVQNTNLPNTGVDGFHFSDLTQQSWPYYNWSLAVTNYVYYALLDNFNNVLDFVNLGPFGGSNSFASLPTSSSAPSDVNKPAPGTGGNPWVLTPVPGQPTQGVLNQITTGMNMDLVFRGRLLGTNLTGTNIDNDLYFECPTNEAINLPVSEDLVVNDPLVHYTVGDLTWPSGSQNVATNIDILAANQRYSAWPSANTLINTRSGGSTLLSTNMTLQDPLITKSSDWDFPTNKFPSVGMLGQVHRGTPWQTVFLKADSNPAGNPQNWLSWANTLDTYPTGDYALLDLFTTAPNDNAARGVLSVNQANTAPWAAVFSGIAVPGGVVSPYDVDTLLNGETLSNATYRYNGIFTKNVPGINAMRATEFNGIFHNTADILSAPILTVASPYLANPSANSDAVVEGIPQQIMGLLKVGQPRFVIYAFGQALKPKDLYFGATNFDICTNYQITGEFVTRTVCHVVGDPQAANAKIQVDNFNILPGN